MGFFKNEVAKKELKDLLEIHPYFRRVDMPKPILIRVDSFDHKTGKVSWTNQYTSSSSDFKDFLKSHEHLTDDDSILDAKILFGEED